MCALHDMTRSGPIGQKYPDSPRGNQKWKWLALGSLTGCVGVIMKRGFMRKERPGSESLVGSDFPTAEASRIRVIASLEFTFYPALSGLANSAAVHHCNCDLQSKMSEPNLEDTKLIFGIDFGTTSERHLRMTMSDFRLTVRSDTRVCHGRGQEDQTTSTRLQTGPMPFHPETPNE